MNNKIFSTASRTVMNVFTLGLISAGAIFAFTLLKESGNKVVGTFANDIRSIKESSRQAA